MFKKVALIALILLVLGAILVSRLPQKATITNQLSDRSKTFIKEQELENNSQYSSLLKEGTKKGQQYFVGDCFSIIIPFGITNQRQKEGCSSYFSFDRPRGTIVVFSEKSSDSNLERASGFLLRKQNPEQYEEKSITVGQDSYVVFRDKNENYTVTTYRYVDGQFFVLTLSLVTEDEASLKQILSSVEFN